jgi:hypothetical protein
MIRGKLHDGSVIANGYKFSIFDGYGRSQRLVPVNGMNLTVE